MEDVGQFTGQLMGIVENNAAQVSWQTGTTQNAVILSFPTVAGTSNSTSMSMIGLPTNLWPQSLQTSLMRVQDNGINVLGLIQIGADGAINFFKDLSGGAFTAAGIKGVPFGTVCYVRGI